MKIFWDTNILIDLLSDARQNHINAIKLFDYHFTNVVPIYLTSLTLANANYILAAHHEVFDFNHRFLQMQSTSDICIMNNNQAIKALKSDWSDFEDALQYQSALAAGCDIIITRDKKGFKKSVIRTLTPEEFLDEYK